MHPIVYYIVFFLVIGGIGMAIANRKATPSVRKQRWLKYTTYIFFTGAVVLSIIYDLFPWLAGFIIMASLMELVKVNMAAPVRSSRRELVSLLLVLLAGAGFLLFAINFYNPFLLFIYFQILVFDGFCQITGQLFGKHPLAPKASPAKTWEGLIGGWLFCILAAVMSRDWTALSLYEAVLFGLFTGLTGFTGDLLASWYKRKVQVKDYSNWLPGQGGFLDRFDSFLLTGAIYYLIYLITFKRELAVFVKV